MISHKMSVTGESYLLSLSLSLFLKMTHGCQFSAATAGNCFNSLHVLFLPVDLQKCIYQRRKSPLVKDIQNTEAAFDSFHLHADRRKKRRKKQNKNKQGPCCTTGELPYRLVDGFRERPMCVKEALVRKKPTDNLCKEGMRLVDRKIKSVT